jgi:hypothetical protein
MVSNLLISGWQAQRWLDLLGQGQEPEGANPQ